MGRGELLFAHLSFRLFFVGATLAVAHLGACPEPAEWVGAYCDTPTFVTSSPFPNLLVFRRDLIHQASLYSLNNCLDIANFYLYLFYKLKMQITREQLIEEIKKVAKKLGKETLSRKEFVSNSEIHSDGPILKFFDNWNEAVEEAGLIPHTENRKIDENELFIEMEKVFLSSGGICVRAKFNKLSKYHSGTYERRFGRWNNSLKAFSNWLENNNKDFPFKNQLIKTTGKTLISDELGKRQTEKIASWNSIGNTRYGMPLNFRGLQHAPLNEQGVVFLFGMICSEIGFIVEAVRTGYPDCEAKRRIDKNQWERVRIEFEFLSSNFKEHGHNPEQCDLIVCWIHDRQECPLEVIELKSEIERISSKQI